MTYYQVNLSAASAPVRDSFREFAHIDVDAAGHHIIVAATMDDIAAKLRNLQLQAATHDSEWNFPAEMLEVKSDTIINGKALSEHFKQGVTTNG